MVGAALLGGYLLVWHTHGSVEQSVYGAVVEGATSGRIKMTAVAISYPSDCEAGRHVDGISDALLARFLESNSAHTRPVRLHALEGRVPVVTWTINQDFFAAPGPLLGHVQGNTLLALSHVGIAEDGKSALVCVQSLSPKFSEGNLLEFEQTEAGWILRNMTQTWIT
jgi:hypothetical protein